MWLASAMWLARTSITFPLWSSPLTRWPWVTPCDQNSAMHQDTTNTLLQTNSSTFCQNTQLDALPLFSPPNYPISPVFSPRFPKILPFPTLFSLPIASRLYPTHTPHASTQRVPPQVSQNPTPRDPRPSPSSAPASTQNRGSVLSPTVRSSGPTTDQTPALYTRVENQNHP